MKLKEKFLNANEDICEKIADEFAIKFMEWYSHKLYSFTDKYTIKELLEIYKQENDL